MNIDGIASHGVCFRRRSSSYGGTSTMTKPSVIMFSPRLYVPGSDLPLWTLDSGLWTVDDFAKSPFMVFCSTESEKRRFHFPHKSMTYDARH